MAALKATRKFYDFQKKNWQQNVKIDNLIKFDNVSSRIQIAFYKY